MNRKHWHEIISALPPGLTLTEAARRCPTRNYAAVRSWLIQFNYTYADGRGKRIPGTSRLCRAPWTTLDWSQRNSDISRQYGVSRQAVSYMRKRLGK